MELEKRGNLIRVCHAVLVDIGGVAVKQYIFVAKNLKSDLILGRPWGRMMRAQMTNMDDGSYMNRRMEGELWSLLQFQYNTNEFENMISWWRKTEWKLIF